MDSITSICVLSVANGASFGVWQGSIAAGIFVFLTTMTLFILMDYKT